MNNGPLPRAAAAAWQEARPARSRRLTALGGQAAVRERGIPTPQAPLRVKAKLLPHRDLPPEAPLLGEAAAHQFNHSKHILGPPPPPRVQSPFWMLGSRGMWVGTVYGKCDLYLLV